MTNYYAELNLKPDSSPEKLAEMIKKEKRKWTIRLNAPDLEKRQLAEKKLALLNEASKNLCNKKAKKNYDKLLSAAQKKGKVESVEKSAMDNSEVEMDSRQSEKKVSGIYLQAQNLYEAGELDGALEFCKRALASGNEDYEIYKLMATCYLEKGDVQGTLVVCRTGSALYPSEIGFLDILSDLALVVQKDYRKADQYVNEILAIDSSYVPALTRKLQLDLLNEKETKAEHDVKKYLQEHPYDDTYRWGAAKAYITYGDSFYSESASGQSYFENKKAYESCLKYYGKAYEIYKTNETKKYVDNIQKLSEKKIEYPMIPAYFFAGVILAAIVGTFAAALPFIPQSFSGLLVFVLMIGFTWGIAKKRAKPEWKLEMEEITGKRGLLAKFSYWYCGYVKMIFSPAGLTAGIRLVSGLFWWMAKESRED